MGENRGEEGAFSEPVGKPYGFSGYLLENPTVRRGERNWVGSFRGFGARRGSKRAPRRVTAAIPYSAGPSSCGFAERASPGYESAMTDFARVCTGVQNRRVFSTAEPKAVWKTHRSPLEPRGRLRRLQGASKGL